MGVHVRRPYLPETRSIPLRSSALSCFEKCPRKFLFRERCGIRPAVESDALKIGGFFHQVIQLYLEGMSPSKIDHVMGGLRDIEKEKMRASASESGFLPGGVDLSKALESYEMTYWKGLAMGHVFWRRCGFDLSKWTLIHLPTEDGNIQPGIEYLVEVKIPEFVNPLRARFDAILVDPDNPNDVWFVDHKTSSIDPLVRAQALGLSPQAAMYRLILQTKLDYFARSRDGFPQLTVKGVIHNVIKTPDIKPGTAEDRKNAKEWNCSESEAYIRRLIKWYENAEAKCGCTMVQSAHRFKGPVMSPELHRRLAALDMKSTGLINLDDFWRAGDYVCHDFNTPCSYLRLCTADEHLWPQLIEENYRIHFRDDEDED